MICHATSVRYRNTTSNGSIHLTNKILTMNINFKEQTVLTIQEHSNATFHSGCKMFTWTCPESPIKVKSMRIQIRMSFYSIKNLEYLIN